MPQEGRGHWPPSPLPPRQPCEERVVAALGVRSRGLRGHVPETWMQGSLWPVPLFLCPTAWRSGLGVSVRGRESPGDRQALAPRPALGFLLAGDLPHCPHTRPRARVLPLGLSRGLQLGGAARRAGGDCGQAGPGREVGRWPWETAVSAAAQLDCVMGLGVLTTGGGATEWPRILVLWGSCPLWTHQ